MNYIDPQMEITEINRMSMLALAHIGDGVYELLTRTKLCTEGFRSAAKLHFKTVSLVNAKAQAAAVEKLLPLLTEDETAVFKRGRNATVGEYHAATGLEALFGWLYLQGKTQRINELYNVIVGD